MRQRNLLFDDDTRPIVTMLDYEKIRIDLAEFCRYYAKRLGGPIMEKHVIDDIGR